MATNSARNEKFLPRRFWRQYITDCLPKNICYTFLIRALLFRKYTSNNSQHDWNTLYNSFLSCYGNDIILSSVTIRTHTLSMVTWPSLFIPTKRGLPRRTATTWLGNTADLNTRANAPFCTGWDYGDLSRVKCLFFRLVK